MNKVNNWSISRQSVLWADLSTPEKEVVPDQTGDLILKPVVPNSTSTADPAIVPSKFIISLVSELKSVPDELGFPKSKCDKCQYSGPWDAWKGCLRKHREEKHRIWDCLRCCATFPNKIAFGNHSCVLHPLGMPDYGRPNL